MPDGTPTTTPPRRRLPPEARQPQILEAAFEEFAAHGYAGARMAGVASRAGVAKGLVYHYYPSKEALFRAVMQASLEGLFAAAEHAAADPDAPAFETLARLLDLAYAERRGGAERGLVLFRLLIAEAARFPELSEWYEAAVFRRARAIAQAVLRHGAARGEFDPHLAQHDGMAEALLAPAIMADIWRMLLGDARSPNRESLREAQLALLKRALRVG